MAHIHYPGAYRQEEHPVFLVLRVELGHNHIQGRFEGRVQSTHVQLILVGQVKVSQPSRDCNDFFDRALQN